MLFSLWVTRRRRVTADLLITNQPVLWDLSFEFGPLGGLWEVSRRRFFGERAFCGRLSLIGSDLASAQVASESVLTAFHLVTNR